MTFVNVKFESSFSSSASSFPKMTSPGVSGTLLGAVIGLYLLPLGSAGPDLAGIVSATYIGGSMNFAAVAEALEFTQSTLLVAALAADNVSATFHLIFVVMIPSIAFLRRWIPSPIVDAADATKHVETTIEEQVVPYKLAHICTALAISLTISATAYSIADVLAVPSYGILFVTAITLLIANIFHRQIEKLHGTFETGMLMMFIFFVTIGAGADVAVMIDTGVVVFLYTLIVLVVHLLIIILGAKLFGMDLAEIVIASLACIGGPVAPAAISAAKGWKSLVTPGIMVGILGYAIANFIGVGLAELLAG